MAEEMVRYGAGRLSYVVEGPYARKDISAVIIRCPGDINYETSTLFLRAATHAYSEHNHVVVDMGKVDRIDSTGLGAVVEASADGREQGLEFMLVNVRERAAKLLWFIGVTDVLKPYGSIREALSAEPEGRRRKVLEAVRDGFES